MQRVLIVGKGNLFDQGLRRLLSQEQTGLEVLSIIYTNEGDVLQRLLEWRPTVVVLFEGGPLTVSRVFELNNKAGGLATMRVITVLTGTNTVEVYERQQISAIGSGELFELIGHGKQDDKDV